MKAPRGMRLSAWLYKLHAAADQMPPVAQPAHLHIWLLNHALQVLDAGTVVQLVQHNNLQTS